MVHRITILIRFSHFNRVIHQKEREYLKKQELSTICTPAVYDVKRDRSVLSSSIFASVIRSTDKPGRPVPPYILTRHEKWLSKCFPPLLVY